MMFDGSAPTARRSFLGRLALLTAPLAAIQLGTRKRDDPASQQPGRQGDEWLRRLTGTHRTMFDFEQHRNGHGLGQAASMLDAWGRNFRLEPPQVNVVLGMRGSGLPIVLSDALWSRYRLGEQYQITRPGTKEVYEANPFSEPNVRAGGPVSAEQSVEALQRRGVLFLACLNTIAAVSRRLSAAGFGAPDAVRQALERGLLPGVVPVPAMLIAFTQMQERGVSYVYVG